MRPNHRSVPILAIAVLYAFAGSTRLLWAATQTPWQTNAYGTLSTNIAWNYAMGYHFTPLVNGQVTGLGGFFNGARTVKLFNRVTGALLAQATVSAANTWAYTAINPVSVSAGTSYTVAVYLMGAGGSYRSGLTPALPRTFGDIRLDASTYVSTSTTPTARPTNSITTTMYGQADIQFVPATSDAIPPAGTVSINSGASYTNTPTVTLSLSATDNSGTVSQMQFSNNGENYSTPEAYATTKAWTLTAGDETKTVYAKFKDIAGNWSNPVSDTIVLDTTAPTISGLTTSGITSTAATITWTTNESATTQVDYGPTTSYGQSSPLDAALLTNHSVGLSGLSPSTLYHYRARSKDAVGNERVGSDATFTTAAPADTTPPSGSVTINGGAAATNALTVNLTLTATDNSGTVAQMHFSNDNAAYSTPEAYATTKAWTLSTGDGTKTVYVKFKDAVGNWSVAATDTIVLDTTAPTVSAISSAGITSSTATVTWTTNETATSQVDYGLTSSYGQSTALDSALVTSHSVTLTGLTAGTLYHYRVRSKDAAGNEQLSSDATFTTAPPPDTIPPTGTISINGPAAATNVRAVTLTLFATDNAGAVAQMRFSDDGATYSAPEAYATTKAWTLPAGDGAKTVWVQFADPAGNWSAGISDTITLDTTPPQLDFTSPTDGQVITAPTP